MRGPITTHVLDLARGRPAANVEVELELATGQCLRKRTDGDGRVMDFLAPGVTIEPGVYRLRFFLTEYFAQHGLDAFFPEACLVFEIAPTQVSEHFHVPLLLSPFGFSTYRGS